MQYKDAKWSITSHQEEPIGFSSEAVTGDHCLSRKQCVNRNQIREPLQGKKRTDGEYRISVKDCGYEWDKAGKEKLGEAWLKNMLFVFKKMRHIST